MLFAILGAVVVLIGWPLGWGWIKNRVFRFTHLVCVVIVPIEAVFGVLCPLTTWENKLRLKAGQTPDELSFVGRLTRDVLFYEAPPWVFTVCYVVFGLLVIATFLLVPPPLRNRGADVSAQSAHENLPDEKQLLGGELGRGDHANP